MMQRLIVVDQTYAPYFLQWMSERIGEQGEFDPRDTRTIAHVLEHDDGTYETLCVVALNRWTTHSCEGNIASDKTKRWFSRDFAFTVYDYAFRYAGKTRMNFTVRPENIEAVQMHRKLGHKFEACLEDGFGEGKDALIYGLTRKQWVSGPWSKPSRINIKIDKEKTNGKECISTAST